MLPRGDEGQDARQNGAKFERSFQKRHLDPTVFVLAAWWVMFGQLVVAFSTVGQGCVCCPARPARWKPQSEEVKDILRVGQEKAGRMHAGV